MSAGSPEQRWSAVQRRDPHAGGSFVYAVTTTGVYCRPTCASRRPLREHVVFFDSPARAEADGFRACRKCKPAAATLPVPHIDAIQRACQRLRCAPLEPSLDDLAAEAGLSRFHFHRVFRQIVGITPKQYALWRRAGRLRRELDHPDRADQSVTRAIYAAGFSSSGRAYAASPATLGMSPRLFQSAGKGVRIEYAIAKCALGCVMLAATTKGICAIEFGDSGRELRQRIERSFSLAILVPAGRALQNAVQKVLACLRDPSEPLALPLDIQGTVFQQRVWEELRKIPAGQTRSYRQIAAAIGSPRAVRAVGHACAVNCLALAIPCHRAIRSNGSLSGYRWGIARKKLLLATEKGGAPKADASGHANAN